MLPRISNPSGGATVPAQAEAQFPDLFITQFILDVTPSQEYVDACNALAAIPTGQDTTAAQAAVAAAFAADGANQFIAVRYRLFNYANQSFPTAAQLTALGLTSDNLFKIPSPWNLVEQYPAIAAVAGGIIANVPALMALVAAQAQQAAAQAAATAAANRLATDQTALANAQSALAAAQVQGNQAAIAALEAPIARLTAQVATDQGNVAATAAALAAANTAVVAVQTQLGA
jgi:hypothetical protein